MSDARLCLHRSRREHAARKASGAARPRCQGEPSSGPRSRRENSLCRQHLSADDRGGETSSETPAQKQAGHRFAPVPRRLGGYFVPRYHRIRITHRFLPFSMPTEAVIGRSCPRCRKVFARSQRPGARAAALGAISCSVSLAHGSVSAKDPAAWIAFAVSGIPGNEGPHMGRMTDVTGETMLRGGFSRRL
jgi:hypothetical protein